MKHTAIEYNKCPPLPPRAANSHICLAFELLCQPTIRNGTEAVTLCKNQMDTVISIPSRWEVDNRTHAQALADIDRCAALLARAVEASRGLYLRICDSIRLHGLTDGEIRAVLSKHFQPPRVSEFLLIARAPDEVYRRYQLGFVGFRATLSRCRGYTVHSSDFLKRRKIRRAAERIIDLLGPGEVCCSGMRVVVESLARVVVR